MAQGKGLPFFERYLSLWVAICILVGIGIGWLFPKLLKRREKNRLYHGRYFGFGFGAALATVGGDARGGFGDVDPGGHRQPHPPLVHQV